MLRTIVLSSLKMAVALPAVISALFGLIQAGEGTGFDKQYPDQNEKLINLFNNLLWVLVEYWFVYIILSIGLGCVWALLVEEPKKKSKRKFEKKRKR